MMYIVVTSEADAIAAASLMQRAAEYARSDDRLDDIEQIILTDKYCSLRDTIEIQRGGETP